MESLHEGANIILCVWTYFRRGLSPVDVDWDTIRNSPPKAKTQLKYISDDIQRLMIALCTTSEGDSKTQSHPFSFSLHGLYSNQDSNKLKLRRRSQSA